MSMILLLFMSEQETDSVLWHDLVWYVVVEKLDPIDTGEWRHHVIVCRDRSRGRGQRPEVRRRFYSIRLSTSASSSFKDIFVWLLTNFFFFVLPVSFFFGKRRSAYLCPFAKVARKSQLAQDPEGILGKKLWDLCEALVREKVKDH